MDVTVHGDLLGDEEEAELTAWLVADGTAVESGQPIAELETGKASVEFTAPAAGTLSILVGAGEVVAADTVVARLA
ncbi:lipoyl domain-containing protein [Streptomyces sp. NPDC047002]|uniref:Lipoyl-binding domain-containing protein n=1 Tax=Streptomyces tremellae TaxID=1124239 RepID=A0ABP7EBV0_9ACTN